MAESAITNLYVSDIVIIPELNPNQRHLIINTELPGSAARIRFVERTLAVQEENGPVSEELGANIRNTYVRPPYEVPHE